jgi:hypothetical protein
MAKNDTGALLAISTNNATRWDIAKREQDLKLFIKVPTTCRSSIVILEGDFRHFNNCKYSPNNTNIKEATPSTEEIKIYTDRNNHTSYVQATNESAAAKDTWTYTQNHSILNFGSKEDTIKVDTNTDDFTPIGKLQLLAFNTGESYPFADRLVEYLSGSAITPVDEIPDNIKRVQKVMKQNGHYFKIEGLWENKMQKIMYDYVINSGPIEPTGLDGALIDQRRGYHSRLGHTSKSTLYDFLGYVDKDAEKWYASWTKEKGDAKIIDTIQNVDIYDGLYDI